MSCSFYSEDSPCEPAPGRDDVTIFSCFAEAEEWGLSKMHRFVAKLTSYSTVADVFSPPKNRRIHCVPWTIRYSLTYGWAGSKWLTCCHPNHSGKRTLQKMPRCINIEMSRSIYILENQAVPVGAGMKN